MIKIMIALLFSVKFCSGVVIDFLTLLDKHNILTLSVKIEKLTKILKFYF
jgi:hypothetical protein